MLCVTRAENERGQESELAPFCGALHSFSRIFLGMIVRFSEGDGPPGSQEVGDLVAWESRGLESGSSPSWDSAYSASKIENILLASAARFHWKAILLNAC